MTKEEVILEISNKFLEFVSAKIDLSLVDNVELDNASLFIDTPGMSYYVDIGECKMDEITND